MRPCARCPFQASLVLAFAVSILMVAPGWGDEPSLERLHEAQRTTPANVDASTTQEPETTAPGLGLSPKERLRLLTQRFLDRITSSQGTNATAIIGRFQVQTEYRDLRAGDQAEWRNTARVDLPIGRRFLIRADVPYYNARFDQSDPSHTWVSGLGNAFIRMGALVYDAPALKVFAGGDVGFPTADSGELGNEKYTLGPGFAIGAPVPDWGIMLFWRFQQVVSVGGDPDTREVDYSRFRFRFVKPLSEDWWVHAEPEVRIDWTRGARTAVLSQFEIGRKMDKHWRLFTRPAVGFSGDHVPGTYDWFIRFGVRYMF